MKKFVSILLVMTLVLSVFTMTSISTYAEETGDEVVDDNTTPDDTVTDDNTTEGDDTVTDEGTTEDDGTLDDDTTGDTTTDDTTDGGEEGTTPEEGAGENTEETTDDSIWGFVGAFLPVDALKGLADALFGLVAQMWNFVMNNETYGTIVTAALAVLTFLAIPFVFGVVVVVYVSISGMMIFAGALTGIVELLFPMIPKLF